ncbi:MAG TPA: ammonium transporter [Steroidobacteraceae bacterium]|jgi:Amt family ammonium transporter|nr:ammonium transporter [Steroidobacteraceae bacterium]
MSRLFSAAGRLCCACVCALLPFAAQAAANPAIARSATTAHGPNSGDTAWLLTATALVLSMTLPGLVAFYSGLVRSKNVLSVAMQCFAIACLVSLLWVAGGYGLAFGNGGSWQALIGSPVGAFDLNRGALRGTIPEAAFVMFQLTFAIITPALVIGGFAERMKFSAMLWFSGLWLVVVYVPVCHWVWGGGWLAQRGVLDFAGGIVVHVTAGVGALVSALVLRERKGFPHTAMPPHNMPLTILGAGMLWVGWFGFNGGSALAANGSAAMAILITHLGAATGALAWMTAEWLRFGKPSVLGIITGMVAGLGTITPASGFVGPLGAIAIGAAAGLVCFSATQILKRKLHVDDSLDVSPVHGVGGALGTTLTGIFVASGLGGVGYAAGMTLARQVGVQILGVAAAAIWCVIGTYLILKALQATIGLRVSEDQEREGLDLSQHGERAYIE